MTILLPWVAFKIESISSLPQMEDIDFCFQTSAMDLCKTLSAITDPAHLY